MKTTSAKPTWTDLLVDETTAQSLKDAATNLVSWDLNHRQLWDLELLLNGAFFPLNGFLGKADYESVCQNMRLTDGSLWPMPINLDVDEAFAESLNEGDQIALRHPEGMVLATLTVSDIWQPDFAREAQQVFGTTDEAHPAVFSLMNQTNPFYVGGTLQGIELPPHHTFKPARHTPKALKEAFVKLGWEKIVAFQTRNPLHRAHVELTKRAVAETGANLLLHPVVGRTSPGDVDYFSRVRCYQAVIDHYPESTAMLSLLPLAMRMGGPREAVWHALIRKNYGCTHFIIGRDHAGPGKDKNGNPFYGPYDAQALAQQHEAEMGINILTFEEMVYVQEVDEYMPRSTVSEDATILSLSGTELRQALRRGTDVPEWFSYPEVMAELRRSYPPRPQQGLTVFFTGLSGSGKSTIANVLVAKLMEIGNRPVTLLDGDIVRKNLSSELGFSKEHRDLNIKRIGYVASEITKNRGIAVCAPIAPYTATRREVREMIEQYGGFIEIHIATPIEVCETRDRKGLYAKARAGLIKEFTGIDDPYEAPEQPEVKIDTTSITPDEAAQQILDYLDQEGFLKVHSA